MKITTIENPSEDDCKPIEDGIMVYGLAQMDSLDFFDMAMGI